MTLDVAKIGAVLERFQVTAPVEMTDLAAIRRALCDELPDCGVEVRVVPGADKVAVEVRRAGSKYERYLEVA